MVLNYIFLSISYLCCFLHNVNNPKDNINMKYVTWFTRHKNDCFLNFAPAYIQVHFYDHPDWVNINCPEKLSCLASKLLYIYGQLI
jgi:hypothetical protein